MAIPVTPTKPPSAPHVYASPDDMHYPPTVAQMKYNSRLRKAFTHMENKPRHTLAPETSRKQGSLLRSVLSNESLRTTLHTVGTLIHGDAIISYNPIYKQYTLEQDGRIRTYKGHEPKPGRTRLYPVEGTGFDEATGKTASVALRSLFPENRLSQTSKNAAQAISKYSRPISRV